MEIRHRNIGVYNRVTRVISTGCGTLFALYSFLYLYFLQGNVTEALHFSLSHGRTAYSIFWSALVITFFLMLLRWGINAVLKLSGPWIALSYYPPALLLGVLTDVDRSVFQGGGFAPYWSWLLPLLSVVYVSLALILRRVERNKEWNNVLDMYSLNAGIFAVGCLVPVLIGNTDMYFHHELAVEHAIRHGEYAKALNVGKKSLKATKTLTVLRAYAMASFDSLGEKLFEYPQTYKSAGLLFDANTPPEELLHFNADTLYCRIGAKHDAGEKNMDYLSRISKIDSIPQTGKQYYLCALLLEKRLVDFCQAIQTVYPEGRALPKHYREALLLCERELPGYRSHIDDLTLRQKLDEFFEKRRSEYPSELAEQNLMRRDYGRTYWWYYYYQ